MTGMDLGLGYGGLLLGAAAVFAGGYARGYSGFGSSAIVMAVMTLILPPHQVVPIAIMLEIIAGLAQASGVRHHIDWRLLLTILAGAAIATPAGTKALLFLDPAALRFGILAFILVVSLVLLTGKTLSGGNKSPVAFIAGLVSGFANGAAALAGLPIALFLAAGNTTGTGSDTSNASAAVMRATLIIYISAIGIFTAILLARDGFYDDRTLWRIAAALPLLAAGLFFGGRKFGATTPQSFRRFTLVLLISLSVLGLARSL